MIPKEEVDRIVGKYDKKKITVGTIGSHTALQILKGARDEGFRTLAVCVEEQKIVYEQFNVADEIITVGEYKDILGDDIQERLIKKNTVLIPHGSFVEYVGSKNIEDRMAVPMLGNRLVLDWESDRDRGRELLVDANIKVPKKFNDPEEIDRLVMVKFPGAKGGKGYFLAKNEREFHRKMRKYGKIGEKYTIQEYVIGTLLYPHYFYSPLTGKTELLSMDIRYESNIDGLTRIPSTILSGYKVDPSYVVTGNIPIVARESLLPRVIRMGQNLVEVSKEKFEGGMWGPFCIESVCTKDLEICAFEFSARIVAGTNLYIRGSPYSQILYDEPMSTGRRISREIKNALSENKLNLILY